MHPEQSGACMAPVIDNGSDSSALWIGDAASAPTAAITSVTSVRPAKFAAIPLPTSAPAATQRSAAPQPEPREQPPGAEG